MEMTWQPVMTWQPHMAACLLQLFAPALALGRLSGPSQGLHVARGGSHIHRLGVFAIHAKVAIFVIVEDLL